MTETPESFFNDAGETIALRPGEMANPAAASALREIVGAPSPARSRIILAAGELPRIVEETENALVTCDGGLFQRGGAIVILGEAEAKAADERQTRAVVVREATVDHLRERAMKVADFVKYDEKEDGYYPVDPPLTYFKALVARGTWRLRPLAGIICAPTLRRDGSILDQPGYDERTGLYFDPRGESFPAIPVDPTRADGEAALERLLALVKTFPFKADEDRAVFLSAVLTALVRRTLPAAPMHCFSAPVAGSGKSMVVDMISIIVTGWPAPVIAPARDEEKLASDLDAALLSGFPVVTIDNLAAPLDSVVLCQMLTQENRAIRLFHTQRQVEVSTSTFVAATGNNLRLVGDLTRRALVSTIDPETERPELREFKTSPLDVVRKARGSLAADALAVLRAYILHGAPVSAPVGSFERWSRVVRDCLVWFGKADPVRTMEAARALDPATEVIAEVMEQWAKVMGSDSATAKRVIDAAQDRYIDIGSTSGAGALRHPEFRDLLLNIAGQHGVISNTRLGTWLARYQGKIVSGRRFVRDGTREGSAKWKLETTKAG